MRRKTFASAIVTDMVSKFMYFLRILRDRCPLGGMRPALLLASVLLFSCAVNQAEREIAFDQNESWALLPIVNYSQTPQAGERAERIAATLLRSEGLKTLSQYPPQEDANGLPILDENRRFNSALGWAQDSGLRYGITGSIEEWRYKAGLDGEPAVGLSVQVIDIASGDVLWSGSGSRAGWSRESLSGTAHKVLEKLIAKIKLD